MQIKIQYQYQGVISWEYIQLRSLALKAALCHWNHFAKSRFDSESRGIYRNLTSEAEDTTHKGKWSVGDWKNDISKSMASREGELVFLKWWDSCEVVCNWDSTASNGIINGTKTHANHRVEIIGLFCCSGQ